MACVLSFPPAFFSHLNRGSDKPRRPAQTKQPFVSAVRGRWIGDPVDKLEVASAGSQWVNILSLAKLTADGLWLLWPRGRRSPSVNKEM